MALYYDSDGLIDSIKRRINIPENQSTFTRADLLAFANEEIALAILPAIMSLHEDYLLFQEDIPLVSGQGEYPIPYRAAGNKLYDIQFVDTGGSLFELCRVKAEDEPMHQESNGLVSRHSFYYLRNNNVVLLPHVSDNQQLTGSLRFIYYIRPSELVETDRIGIITAIDTVTGIVTVNEIPEHFTTQLTYDFYKVKSPHSILAIDLSTSDVNTTVNTITFDPDELPSQLAVGDHIGQSTESSIPQIPSDLHVFLAQKVAERVLEAQGDSEGLQAAKIKSAEMEIKAGNIIDNRVESSPIKLVNRNGALRLNMSSRRRG